MEEETSMLLQMKISPNIVHADIVKMWLQELMQSRVSNHTLHTLVTYKGKERKTWASSQYIPEHKCTHREECTNSSCYWLRLNEFTLNPFPICKTWRSAACSLSVWAVRISFDDLSKDIWKSVHPVLCSLKVYFDSLAPLECIQWSHLHEAVASCWHTTDTLYILVKPGRKRCKEKSLKLLLGWRTQSKSTTCFENRVSA